MKAWLVQFFDTDLDSSVIRRSITDVHHYASKEELIEACIKREYLLLEIGNQYVVVRNQQWITAVYQPFTIFLDGFDEAGLPDEMRC